MIGSAVVLYEEASGRQMHDSWQQQCGGRAETSEPLPQGQWGGVSLEMLQPRRLYGGGLLVCALLIVTDVIEEISPRNLELCASSERSKSRMTREVSGSCCLPHHRNFAASPHRANQPLH